MTNVLTVDELAATLRVSRASAYALVHSGLVRSIRIGRTIRVPASAVTEFLDGDDESDAATPDGSAA